MLTFSGVCKSFDGRPALVDVSLAVHAGTRTALLGVNGSGKSTLLGIAAGQIPPDRGSVSIAPAATVAHVPQDYGVIAGVTVEAYLKGRAGVLQAEQILRNCERRLADGDPDHEGAALASYADALDRFTALGGYEIQGPHRAGAGGAATAACPARPPARHAFGRPAGSRGPRGRARLAVLGVPAR